MSPDPCYAVTGTVVIENTHDGYPYKRDYQHYADYDSQRAEIRSIHLFFIHLRIHPLSGDTTGRVTVSPCDKTR